MIKKPAGNTQIHTPEIIAILSEFIHVVVLVKISVIDQADIDNFRILVCCTRMKLMFGIIGQVLTLLKRIGFVFFDF